MFGQQNGGGADGVTRALAIAAIVLTLANILWSVYTWRRSNWVKLRVRTWYQGDNHMSAGRMQLIVTMRNQSRSEVTVTRIWREVQVRGQGLRLRRWVEERSLDTNDPKDAPAIEWSGLCELPTSLTRHQSVVFAGRDHWAEEQRGRSRWRFRAELADGTYFVSRRASRDSQGRILWQVPFRRYRVRV